MRSFEGNRRQKPSLAASVAASVFATAVTLYLQLGSFPERIIPLAYALPLLIALWHRDRRILWAMSVCFLVGAYVKLVVLLPDEFFGEDYYLQYVFTGIQWVNILVPAAVIHGFLNYGDRLELGNARLANANAELVAGNTELAAREAELFRRNEELQRQGEELQTLNEELAGREDTLQLLLQLSGPMTGETQLLEQLCAAAPGLLGADVAAVAVLEQRGDSLVVRAHSEFGGVVEGEALPAEATLAVLAMEKNRVVQVEDTQLRPDLQFPKSPSGAVPRSILSAPLLLWGRPVGALEAYADQSRSWTPQHAQLLEWLAAQCSRAWESARLKDERKLAEETVRDNERRLRTILDALPVAIFLSDAGGNVVFTNPAVERFWGICTHVTRDRYGEYQGRWFPAGETVQPEEWALALALETGEPSTNDLVEIDRGGAGRLIVKNYAIPIHGEGGQMLGVVVVTEDVTQRVRGEEQLRLAKETAERTAEELGRSNRDLEQFAYVASHDLQEPLRMVAGYLQLLSERYRGKLDEKADKFIAYAVDGAERMSTLIRDLLAYSRVNRRGESPEKIESREAYEMAARSLGSAIRESGAAVSCDALPSLRADRTQMAQLFQNLIGNAIKFRSPDRPPQIHVAVQPADGQWIFSVRDNGIGFDQQYEEKLFLIFQRLHSRGNYPGTGIGLAICKRIVERHGGRIWAAGTPGQGSIFYFSIPQ